MREEIVVDIEELSQVFITCRNEKCGTEIGFDLSKDFYARNLNCPVCGNDIYEAQRADGHDYTWPVLLKRLFKAEDRPRLTFKIKRPARSSDASAMEGPGGVEPPT